MKDVEILGKTYQRFNCIECGEEATNTFVEHIKTEMRERQLCFACNHWRNFENNAKHKDLTIIDGTIYVPGNRTTGSFRGMAGRRFDIEYISPSRHAGKRITTFDLWCGGKMPHKLHSKFTDTAKFLNGAERVTLQNNPLYEACWNPSNTRSEPYPLPKSIGIGS